jgi:hypothetical protein
MFGRIDRRQTPIIFISGMVKFKNQCVRLTLFTFRDIGLRDLDMNAYEDSEFE